MACEPLAGKRYLKVTEHRTKHDFAQFIRDLVDVSYPSAEKIILVLDNLNTHTPAALYEAFPQPRRDAWWRSWKSTLPPSTAVG